jgi:hypothetical protein
MNQREIMISALIFIEEKYFLDVPSKFFPKTNLSKHCLQIIEWLMLNPIN